MTTTNQASKATMRELLQDEIDRCKQIIERLRESSKAWNSTVGSTMKMDIESAEKALDDKNNSAMFRSYRALRIYN